ncbi:LssY C-terminal domain-containing protein [Naasia aerilata]|uniref:LssY-like C-terminal domain-containing protein n=1 Tax=Naasia aerilata TaxID=1162966 RepID=A0ABN6XHU4_9MICO|nr:LssY C-terminal domain-containing protein [Naasia aerilata]BDZ44441.1 hypothetical protein GCM10025866_03500 [Naasia aerilata]
MARRRVALPFTERALAGVDNVFFLLGAVAAGWLAVLTVRRILIGGIEDLWLVLVFWVVLAYLLLPRVHTILTRVYVPDYFIGRTRTYEGLLGDPVNLGFLGNEDQLHTAMRLAGWDRADELGFRSGLRIVTSTLTRRSYLTAPVSPLFLFGGMQEFTYQQQVAGDPRRRHHVRFWKTPPGWLLPGGARADWLAAGTYDRSVGLSIFTLQITHKIDADIDQERDHIVATILAGSSEVERTVIRNFSSGFHSRNGGGDAIATDGDLPILDVRAIRAAPAEAPLPDTATAGPGAAAGSGRPVRASARSLLDTAKDTAASNRVKRPMTLYAGYLLMLARVALAIVVALAAAFGAIGSSVMPRMQSWLLGVPEGPDRVWILLLLILAAGGAYLFVAQYTFWGHPDARFVALTLSVAGVVLALLAGPVEPTGLGFRIWVLELALDVGILITLSAGDVREFHVRTAHRAGWRSVVTVKES